METKKVILAATGSVASVRVPQIYQELVQRNFQVKVIVTESAKRFIQETDIPMIDDFQLWEAWDQQKTCMHIDLAVWADLLLIAPLDANTLAKMACGMCDNLVVTSIQTTIVRAWDSIKPIVVAPAMNTVMWENPFTEEHIQKIKSVYNVKVEEPIVKLLACKTVGKGCIQNSSIIADTCLNLFNSE